MKRPILILIALLALSACRVDEYYAEGAGIAARDRARAACEAEARAGLSERIEIRRTPRHFHPGIRQCTPAGLCRISAPYWTGGQPYSVDLNENARAGVVTSCMAVRGYTLISLPPCPAGVAAATTMAPLTGNSCILRRQNGGLIVSP